MKTTRHITLDKSKFITRDMLPLPQPTPEGYVEPEPEPFDIANLEIDAAGYFVRPKKEPPVKEHPVVLALDLSITRTGWAVSDLDGITAGAQGFPLAKGEHPALRFRKFSVWLDSMLRLHQPDIVLYEESNSKQMASNHIIQCAVALSSRLEEHCAAASIPTKKTMPSSLKKAFLGDAKRDEGKARMKAKCAELFPDYEIEKDVGGDECDARALAWTYANKPEVFEPKGKAKPKKKAVKLEA